MDPSGALRVGPRSAGSSPGPVCYGRGGHEPTVTDANLALGRIDPKRFLGGEIPLDGEAALAAIAQKIAAPLAMSPLSAADGILKVASNAMSYAVRGVTTQRGIDAASLTLVAYGGAGPLHAAAVAKELGIRRVIIPTVPGNFCAFGMLFSDLRYDVSKTWFMPLADPSFGRLQESLAEMTRSARRALAASGVAPIHAIASYAYDMRYVGQEHSVNVDIPEHALQDRDAIKQQFDEVYLQRYGVNSPGEAAELVGLRVAVTGVMSKPEIRPIDTGTSVPPASAVSRRRDVYFGETGRLEQTPIFKRSVLLAGNVIAGPALIEEYATTTVVCPGDRLRVDTWGNLEIETGAA